MNVLAIGSHPDDIEILCAGTLIKHAKRGDKVIICHATDGEMGHAVIMPEVLRNIRTEEAEKSGALAGIEVISAHLPDSGVNGCDISHRDAIIEVIRYADPDYIITHSPTDYMPDHVAVQKLVFDAAFVASVPHYGKGAAARVTPLYYMDNLAGMNFSPTEYVDISDELDLKLKMLCCHQSQLVWMREHDGIDFADFVRTCAKYRGLQCNAAYAEAFTQAFSWPKVTTKRMLP